QLSLGRRFSTLLLLLLLGEESELTGCGFRPATLLLWLHRAACLTESLFIGIGIIVVDAIFQVRSHIHEVIQTATHRLALASMHVIRIIRDFQPLRICRAVPAGRMIDLSALLCPTDSKDRIVHHELPSLLMLVQRIGLRNLLQEPLAHLVKRPYIRCQSRLRATDVLRYDGQDSLP